MLSSVREIDGAETAAVLWERKEEDAEGSTSRQKETVGGKPAFFSFVHKKGKYF